MAQDPLITIRNIRALDDLISVENNVRRLRAETPEIRAAIRSRDVRLCLREGCRAFR